MENVYPYLVAEILNRVPKAQAIYIFGSRAEGTHHSGSDVDLAILSGSRLSQTELWELAQILASNIGVDVEIVDLGRASTVMQMQVISSGQRLYCADEKKCSEFEDLVFSSYARLNEERDGILKDIARRGSVYG